MFYYFLLNSLFYPSSGNGLYLEFLGIERLFEYSGLVFFIKATTFPASLESLSRQANFRSLVDPYCFFLNSKI
jgi:hypothetical protein